MPAIALPPTNIVVNMRAFERGIEHARRVVALLGSETSPTGGNRQERRKRKKAERTARKRGR